MDTQQKQRVIDYLEKFAAMESDAIVETVNSYLDDDTIEHFVDHIEDFYGIEDDEQLGVLAQIMISGYVVAMETSKQA